MIRALGVAALCALSLGCGPFFGFADFQAERAALESSGAKLRCTTSFHVGRALLRCGASALDGDEARLARAVDRVDFAVFEVADARGLAGSAAERLAAALPGAEPIVRVVERGRLAAVVFARSEKGAVRELLVAALDKEELTLVRLRGDVGGLVETGIALSRRRGEDGRRDAPSIAALGRRGGD
ncbi:MAG: DUF4252 domain-containing protein [Candidatus Polarisedimenticolia bacterium]|nr:DUF4252 domain-containing protein [bacterium]